MSTQSSPSLAKAILNQRMLICIFTGFSSGLPLYILIQLVPAWLRSEGVGLAEIGLFALIQLPYNWKFAWAPLLDRYALPFLGLRRGWLILCQIALAISIALLPFYDLENSLMVVAYFAAVVAFFSATQDVLLDAYRRELLPDEELGIGNSIHINAYRLAGLVPGALSLVLADHFDWSTVFLVTACFMGVGVIMTLCIKELEHSPTNATLSFQQTFTEPFADFFKRLGTEKAFYVLAFILLYKFGDNMATALASPFYIDMGFSLTEIGLIAKNAGLWPMIFGSIIGGIIMIKAGINRSLWMFGVVQIVSIFGFALLTYFPGNKWMLALIISFEYLGVGLGAAAITAFMARTANKNFAATQLALLTAIVTLPRTLANSLVGFIVEDVGWEMFFYICVACAIPGMLLLLKVAPWNETEKEG